MKSFFATLKTELKEEFSNKNEAYLLIGEYINWYNNSEERIIVLTGFIFS